MIRRNKIRLFARDSFNLLIKKKSNRLSLKIKNLSLSNNIDYSERKIFRSYTDQKEKEKLSIVISFFENFINIIQRYRLSNENKKNIYIYISLSEDKEQGIILIPLFKNKKEKFHKSRCNSFHRRWLYKKKKKKKNSFPTQTKEQRFKFFTEDPQKKRKKN